MDWKIELVAIPVSHETLRFVQLTPPGSACSVVLGTGITEMAPGSQRGVQIVQHLGPAAVASAPVALEPDATMARIGQGMELSQRAEREDARGLFAEIWDDIGGDSGDPFHRCALAHAMADVQDEVREELAWDLRALEAADLITDERAAQAGVTSPVAGFYPSLHLNLGECYRKLGDLERAREHVRRGRAAVWALGDDGYAAMVKDGLDRLAQRLTSA